jgi:hypothetical protein
MKYILISAISLISGFYIKSYFFTKVQTPNSPPTFNFTHEQIKEINDLLDKTNVFEKDISEINQIAERGSVLDKDLSDKLDEDFKNILGEEDYSDFTQEMQEIQDELQKALQDIFN